MIWDANTEFTTLMMLLNFWLEAELWYIYKKKTRNAIVFSVLWISSTLPWFHPAIAMVMKVVSVVSGHAVIMFEPGGPVSWWLRPPQASLHCLQTSEGLEA